MRDQPEGPFPDRLLWEQRDQSGSRHKIMRQHADAQSGADSGELGEHAGGRNAQPVLMQDLVEIVQLRAEQQLVYIADEIVLA